MFMPLVNIFGMYATLLCVLLFWKPWHLPLPSQYLVLGGEGKAAPGAVAWRLLRLSGDNPMTG
jgi:hypothetical protein